MIPERPARPEDGEEMHDPIGEESAAELEDEVDEADEVEELEAESEGAAAEVGPELTLLRGETDRLLRQLAEGENRFRRMERERARDLERFRGELLEKLLPVVDDFDRAMEQLTPEDDSGLAEGLRLVGQRLKDGLGELGLEVIPAQGEKFDPRCHEALIQLPNTDAEKGVIVQELQRGYRLGETVIRPSKVAVAG